jgi:phosphatidate cytidylyltransferase
MKNLAFRLATAVVAVPAILAILYLLPWYGFGTLAGLAGAIAALEFFQMSHPGDRVGQLTGLLFTALIFLVLITTNFGITDSSRVIFALIALTPLALLFTLFRPADQSTALLRMTALASGPLYVGTSLAAIACLRRFPGPDRVGAGLVVLTLMIAWFSDTAGYFVGKSVKGPKLYPSVSPNKTWSGSIGGLGGSALGAVLAHFWFLPELPLVPGIIVAMTAGALGQMGDLCESLMKRSAGVKDSGGILPGHGGILDRLDAMMFAALTLYAALRTNLLTMTLH